jgi:hypothetical protein
VIAPDRLDTGDPMTIRLISISTGDNILQIRECQYQRRNGIGLRRKE